MAKPRLVALTGAGISAESGLKTFRDSDGLWEGFSIEDVATPRAWQKAPQRVLDFYNERRKNIAAAEPNDAHRGLVALESTYDVRIVTQNIDDLHERAGSSHVLHLHGEIFSMRSERDEDLKAEIRGDIRMGDLAPDGAQYRPDIVWFEEPVPLIEQAAIEVAQADVFVIVGTSLVVYPAAGLVHAVRPGTPVWVIDKKIPGGIRWPDLLEIEMPATLGVQELLKRLL
jgi:NAD-dependent deacetylase